MLGSKARFVLAVANDRYLFQGDQAAFGKLVQDRKEAVDLLLGSDDLDDHRQVLRQPQHLGGVQHAGAAKPKRPAQHGRAREMNLARPEHDRLVERPAIGLVVLANENSEQGGFLRNLHVRSPSRSQTDRAIDPRRRDPAPALASETAGRCRHRVAPDTRFRTTKSPPMAGYGQAPAATEATLSHPARGITPHRAGIGGTPPHLWPQHILTRREMVIWIEQ